MHNVSFGSNYKINVGNNFPPKVLGEIYDYELKDGIIYSEFTSPIEALNTNIYQKMNICLPDKYDIDFETYLISQGINFKKVTKPEAMNIENIKNRIQLSEEQKLKNYILVEMDTNKLDNILRKNKTLYIEKNGGNGIFARYKQFEEYLQTAQPITATEIIVNDFDGELSISVSDGRHRFAYLRDAGLSKIPIAMSRESYKNAQKYGLV